MGKYKEHPKYNILTVRVTNEQKALFDEIKRHTNKNTSVLMSEAMQYYFQRESSTIGR